MIIPEISREVRRQAEVVRTITPADADYPDVLVGRMGAAAPAAVQLIGHAGVLRQPLVAWFSSGRLPPDLLIPALEMARRLRDDGVVVASGFHSPVEREVLEILTRGPQPVVVCPARTLLSARLPIEWRRAVREGRMLILSTQDARVRRPSVRSAAERNAMVSALAERVFIAGASPGGRLHSLAREVASRGQPLACFDHPANRDLLLLGAVGVACDRPPSASTAQGRL